jgi:hypothetical protein
MTGQGVSAMLKRWGCEEKDNANINGIRTGANVQNRSA